MAKKRPQRKRKKGSQAPDPNVQIEPWIDRRNGYLYMGLLSVALAIFIGWQLFPTEGAARSILIGLGFGVAIWLIFGLSLAFSQWMRGRRQK